MQRPEPDSVRGTPGGASPGAAVLLGMLAAAAVAVLGVELLSGFGAIRQVPLIVLIAIVGAVFALVVHRCSVQLPEALKLPPHPFLVAALLGIGAITLLTAVLAAPNSWDSMTYHLPRVAHWYDQGSLEHYVTGNDRQLWQPPFGEYLVLLGYGALGGRDYLANIPGWLAGVGAVIATMEIGRLLGADSRDRLRLGLFTAAVPSVILHASSTHVDLAGGLWLTVAAWIALSERLKPSNSLHRALWFGVAAGLAIGTKGTSIPLLAPWTLVFLSSAWRAPRTRALLSRLFLVGGVVAALTGSHSLRNIEVFGHPLAPEHVQGVLRPASSHPSSLLSNLVAHATLQMGTPWPAINGAIADGFRGLHSALGIDLGRLYPYFGGFRVTSWNTHEDVGGNPYYFWLGVVAIVVLALSWHRRSRSERLMAVGFLACIVLFSVTVRWQPFNARFQLPILVLLPSCLLFVLLREYPRGSTMALAGALLLALYPLLLNEGRPILPADSMHFGRIKARSILVESREAKYFANKPELYSPYRGAVTALERLQCRRPALKAAYDSWEYPLWALDRRLDLRFEAYAPARPSDGRCALVVLDHPSGWRPAHVSLDEKPILVEGPVVVWRMEP